MAGRKPKSALVATATVTDGMLVVGDGDKAEILSHNHSPDDAKNARRVDVDVAHGKRVKPGDLLPCIEKSLIERGVLVERVVTSQETLGDISGSPESEGDTDVSVEPMTETKRK